MPLQKSPEGATITVRTAVKLCKIWRILSLSVRIKSYVVAFFFLQKMKAGRSGRAGCTAVQPPADVHRTEANIERSVIRK